MSSACKVDRHGSRHLELELTYPLPVGQKKSKYMVDLFFFTPAPLGLTRERYGVQGFLHDLKSHSRYGLCGMPLSRLTDPACELSPLNRLRQLAHAAASTGDFDIHKALYELKILVNLHHDEAAARRQLFEMRLQAGASGGALREHLAGDLRDTKSFIAAVRALYTELMNPGIPEEVRLALRMTDEAISIKSEKELHRLCQLCETHGELDASIREVERHIGEEEAYRKSMKFASVAGPDFSVANESYVYRESNLKKWAQSATYMTRETAKTPVRVGHILASVAAAIAMAFAVTAALLAQTYYTMNSLPWAILIVVAYMLKDRMKEVVRNMLINLVPTLVADRMVRLIDPLGHRKVGRSRERVRFCDSKTIPPEVIQMRSLKSDTFRPSLPAEPVIHFSKTMLLKSGKLLANHQRLASLMEIIRINLGPWLGEMDDPVDELFALQNGRRAVVKASRAYHVNLVVRISGFDSKTPAELFKYRIMLTRNGIERIENIA